MGCQKDWQNCNQSRKDSSTDFLREDQTESRWQKRSGGRSCQRNRGHTGSRSGQSGSTEAKKPGTGSIPCEGQGTGKAGSPDSESQAAKGDFRCRQNERTEDPGSQGDTKNPGWRGTPEEGGSLSIKRQNQKSKAGDTARQNAIRQKQPETIRIKEKPRKQLEPKTIQRRTIKTAPPSAKISIQPEQKLRVASSNALTARMQKQMERRAAKQAAKKAALQTSDGVRRIQKTARAGEKGITTATDT